MADSQARAIDELQVWRDDIERNGQTTMRAITQRLDERVTALEQAQTTSAPERRPYVCPVCLGHGTVNRGFYEGYSTSTGYLPCRSCDGSGIVWG